MTSEQIVELFIQNTPGLPIQAVENYRAQARAQDTRMIEEKIKTLFTSYHQFKE